MPESRDRELLRHMLAAIAYRMQSAVRGAPPSFPDLELENGARTPRQIVEHMTHLMIYSGNCVHGDDVSFDLNPLGSFSAEVERFHTQLQRVAEGFASGRKASISTEQFVQGPLSDALTHIGQLAYLRRLGGSAVSAESFVEADISPDRLGVEQAEPKMLKQD